MCRNITLLRGLEPPATPSEIEAAARQYVRKVGSLSTASQMSNPAVEEAVVVIADATMRLLAALPARRRPPSVLPPPRRL